MKKAVLTMLALISVSVLLTACMQQTPTPSDQKESEPTESTDIHTPAETPNMLEGAGEGGYCGNTVTDVTKDDKTFSFWGSDSVALTDMLLYLDYNEAICQCPIEFTVNTKFGSGYEINLTQFFVRHNDLQVSLTQEQADTIQGIIDRNCDSAA